MTRDQRVNAALRDLDLSVHPDRDALRERVAGLGSKRRERILRAALQAHFDDEARRPYQAELRKLQRDVHADGRRVIVLFEGRDGAGKGGTISRVSRSMDPERVRVVAPGRPSVAQGRQPYLQRYRELLPEPGSIGFFDRSWYNRAMVEPIMGFCTPAEHEAFMAGVGDFEAGLVADGRTTLLKLYLSVSRAEQARRLAARDDDWVSAVDAAAPRLWEAYTARELQLLQRTHTPGNPWWVLRSDDKDAVRLEATKLLLREVPYEGRSQTLDFDADPLLCVRGEIALRRMRADQDSGGTSATS